MKFVDHELSPWCWCHPRVVMLDEGHAAVYHTPRNLTYDFRPRARAELLEGPPA